MTGTIGDGASEFTEINLVNEEQQNLIKSLPLVWATSYSAEGARQNIRYFENGIGHLKLNLPIRVFMSNWTHAVVISFVELAAVKEPHVREWFSTFYEVPVSEAKVRLETYPEWPYDGRTSLEANQAKWENNSAEKVIKQSQLMLARYMINSTQHGRR